MNFLQLLGGGFTCPPPVSREHHAQFNLGYIIFRLYLFLFLCNIMHMFFSLYGRLTCNIQSDTNIYTRNRFLDNFLFYICLINDR